MSDIFDAFESGTATANFFDSTTDPAAEFLAREQAELAKIENDDFGNLNDDKKVVSQENAFSNFGKCFSFYLLL
jgi:hypothetical protein